jgi:uncharacterized membrane protein
MCIETPITNLIFLFYIIIDPNNYSQYIRNNNSKGEINNTQAQQDKQHSKYRNNYFAVVLG